jgi:hypothetical protein
MQWTKANPSGGKRGKNSKGRETLKNGKGESRPEKQTRGFKLDKIFK